MWYFLIKQKAIETYQYQALQQRALLTEVELFNEPYENWYVFSVDRESAQAFIDYLDRDGVTYELGIDRPTRAELLDKMY